MESLSRSLNFELSPDTFDAYAQQMLQGPHEATAATPHLILTAPSISTAMPELSATVSSASSEFLKKLGASLINSIQLQQLRNQLNANPIASQQTSATMDLDLAAHHVSIDSSSLDGSISEYQKQLEYDKFMNEIWIGIVLTLILISMVFCICSCFLYHQFKTWKRNYRSTIVQSQTLDIEAVKLHPDLDDPVPEYTLVSGLPTYEAALELLNKTAPNSCALIVYPSVFNVFNGGEEQQQQQHIATESTTPLLALRPGAAVRLNSNTGSTHTSAVIECGENEYHLVASQPATPNASPAASQPTTPPPSYISVTVNEKKAKTLGGSFKKPKSGKC